MDDEEHTVDTHSTVGHCGREFVPKKSKEAMKREGSTRI